MKKIIIILFLCFLVSGCSCKGNIETILDNDLPGCVVVNEVDNHGGFLGDGTSFAKLDCSKADIDFSKWKKLPLSDNIKEIYEMDMCDANSCGTASKKYGIPEIIDGYYYFYDRHSESTNRLDDTYLNSRASWNFSLVLYDNSNKTMYYYELDT